MTQSRTDECPEEDEIKLGLMEGETEKAAALAKAWSYYSPRLMSWLETKLPGLPSDLAANAVADAFVDMMEAIEACQFDFDQPLARFLFTVTHRSGIDELRKISRRPLGKCDFYESVADLLKNTDTGRNWRTLVANDKVSALSDAFRAFVATLPRQQRSVAQVMSDYLPDNLTSSEMCEEIHHRTGTRPTGVQVKRCLSEIRRKFRELMTKV